MMCSVSLRPVMTKTGTWVSALFCFSRREVSKPSVPGMSASMRMTSGSTFSTIDSACSPSRATRTVMPASSSASVSSLSVSGESSTTSTMSRVSRVSLLRMSAASPFQRGPVSLEIERVHHGPNVCDEISALRSVAFDLAQLFENPADMPNLAEPDQFVDIAAGSKLTGRQRCRRHWRRRRFGVIDPFDVEKCMNLLHQLAQVDRLHQRVIVKSLRFQHVMGIDGIGRQHDDRCALPWLAAQPLRDLPAVHFGHRDVEQNQVRIVLFG